MVVSGEGEELLSCDHPTVEEDAHSVDGNSVAASSKNFGDLLGGFELLDFHAFVCLLIIIVACGGLFVNSPCATSSTVTSLQVGLPAFLLEVLDDVSGVGPGAHRRCDDGSVRLMLPDVVLGSAVVGEAVGFCDFGQFFLQLAGSHWFVC